VQFNKTYYTCLSDTCSTAKDCPKGAGSGCPPFNITDCMSGQCVCKSPRA